MESDCLCLDFALLHVDFVAGENDGNILANTDKITYTPIRRVNIPSTDLKLTMPVWHILVGDTRRDVKHDNSALAIDVIAIS